MLVPNMWKPVGAMMTKEMKESYIRELEDDVASGRLTLDEVKEVWEHIRIIFEKTNVIKTSASIPYPYS